MADSLSPAQARRVALAAQGFGRPRAEAVGTRQLGVLLERVRLLQLDTVNVFERSHYLPVFARLGPYDKALLDRMTFGGRRRDRYVEAWAHVASIVHTDDWPLLAPKRARMRARQLARPNSWPAANPAMLDWLRAELAAKGPTAAGDVEHESNRRRGTWWEWSDVKLGLEHLFDWGEVVVAGRTNFERTYALAADVLPADVVHATVDPVEAERELMRQSLVALGIGTTREVADYYRLPVATAKQALTDLAEAGLARRVDVPGWRGQTWLDAGARVPRRVEAAALLSPFDPVVWERDRALRMFDFHYRIEIYTPAPKRVYGYYTLPVLIDDRLPARVDLKRDRASAALRVQSAWREPGFAPDDLERIVALLHEARAWQGLETIEVVDRGDLAADLADALGIRMQDAASAEPEPLVEQPGAATQLVE